MKRLAITAHLLNIADLGFTLLGMAVFGGLEEANPILAHYYEYGMMWFILAKLILGNGSVHIVSKYKYKKLMVCIVVLYATICLYHVYGWIRVIAA